MQTLRKLIVLTALGLMVIPSVTAESPFRIATFNIQNFGQSKLAKKEVTDTLCMIMRKFDIVAVQELSDVSNRTANLFLNILNSSSPKPYRVAYSRRTGQQPDDRSSCEQYAFYYNTAKVELLDTSLYNDGAHDYFQREPYIAKFRRKSDGLVFLVCTIHTTPEKAVEEIAALAYVAEWIPSRFTNSAHLIFCGDFNASCSYVSDEELHRLKIHQSPYTWIIPDNAKTNLSRNSCAYDRFVVTEPLSSLIAKWGVYRGFSSKAVSDHWPVYIELKSIRN